MFVCVHVCVALFLLSEGLRGKRVRGFPLLTDRGTAAQSAQRTGKHGINKYIYIYRIIQTDVCLFMQTICKSHTS